MNIFELEKEQKILNAEITSKKERIELERSRLGNKAIDYSKPSVQSSPQTDSTLNVIAKISETEQDIEYCQSKLKQNEKEVDRLYNIFKEYKERDKQIYIEKKLYNWSNEKISIKHNGIGKSQIYRILKKIDEMGKKGKEKVIL